jgi:hypothetical protein
MDSKLNFSHQYLDHSIICGSLKKRSKSLPMAHVTLVGEAKSYQNIHIFNRTHATLKDTRMHQGLFENNIECNNCFENFV